MIRPWYRSRLFWLGLPGLVFLLWLWLANAGQSSAFGHTAITGPGETTIRMIGVYGGYIYQATSRDNYHQGWPRGFYLHRVLESQAALDPAGPASNFPLRPFRIIRETTYDREYREIRLAWWVVISTYTAVWLGAVAGWQLRKARLSRRAAAA